MMRDMKGQGFVMSYRTRSWAVVGTLGVALGLFTACGGKSSNDDDPSTPIVGENTPATNSDFAASLASGFCEGIADCCDHAGYPSNTTDCKTALTSQLNAAFASRYSSPNYTYNASAASACVAAFSSGVAACTDIDAMNAVDGICEKVFVGNVALGGTCSASRECVQNTSGSVTCDAGICAATTGNDSLIELAHGTLGDICQATCTDLGDGGSTCSGNAINSDAAYECWTNEGFVCGTSGTCVAAPKLGQTCDDYCDLGAYCSAGLCVAQGTTGSCSWSLNACSSAAYCDEDASQCTMKKADGAACNEDTECLGGQCYGDSCRVWTVANPSTCAGSLDD